MAPPQFKDFDKTVADLLGDDYDSKYSLKVKAKAPHGVGLTITTDCDKSSLSGKVAAKWAHESGFAVDKLEINKNVGITVETSLKGAVPNTKFEFKGNDSNKGDLLATYSSDVATVVGELDVSEFSRLNVSALAGSGPYTGGASVALALSDSPDVKKFDVAGSYKCCDKLFTGLKISDKFANYTASVGYTACPKASIGTQISFKPENSAFSALIGGSYKCNPDTQMKAKVSTDGAVNFSVKQNLSNNCSGTFTVATSSKNFGDYKLGLVGNLG
jgi:serine protease inhibitor ecotin